MIFLCTQRDETMNMEELKKYHQEKEHLARNEGTHPANVMPERRYRSEAEQKAHELAEDMRKEFGDKVKVTEGSYGQEI